jgi:hypothetical protein
MEAGEARRELARAAASVIEEQVTKPPWPGEPQGALRVIAARLVEGGVVLILAHDGYRRTPRKKED